MAYVRDRIDEEYSLLRPDAFAFPVLAGSSFASTLAANDTKFTYQVSTTVSRGYLVACGGELLDSASRGDSSIFTYRSKLPTWRIDLAVAQFNVLRSAADNITVFYLPADSAGASNVLNASHDAVTFYTGAFGTPPTYNGYTVIEIPDGWGSQASDYYFLQTAAAFKDTSKVSEVYHEIGHTWNSTASGEIQRCRYFDEAFASYFEALTIRAIRGDSAFYEDMEKGRNSFVRWAQYDRHVFDTPIAGYGAKELGRHSYTKGAWSLYVLNRIVGDSAFVRIIRTLLAEFRKTPIDFAAFEALCERVSNRDLRKFFQEWIYGTQSSQVLVDNLPIGEIVKRYR
jgi:aminopeptidase N